MTIELNHVRAHAVAANLDALRLRFSIAADLAAEASRAMKLGQQNLAIGTIKDLERAIPEGTALLEAIYALHRMRLHEGDE